jgi:competence protein ComEC
MAERGRAGERAEAFDAAPRRRRAFVWPAGLVRAIRGGAALLQTWAAAEVAPGRLMPWLPVGFGAGIAVYFTAEQEPALSAALALPAIFVLVAFLTRRHAIAFPVLLVLSAVAAGFATATVTSARLGHPVLQAAAFDVTVSGWIEVREERERSDRVAIRVHRIEGRRLDEKLERVRVSVRKETAPAVGTFVELRARLNPPLDPLRPGGYDFARDLYFQGIGATGFALGSIKTAAPPGSPSRWLDYAATLDRLRSGLDARIRASLSGDAGAIASALITGKRDAITAPVNDAMYISGLGHVLSISGYHMVIVTFVVFATLRAGLALAPGLAARRPIKKWSAFAALVAAAFYLVLSGAEVATQRAFIMTAIVLVGVMVDRPALTLRNLALAALGVLLLAPAALVHPSFQMSFAATLALVAVYERGLPWMRPGAETRLAARIALWGGREIAALLLASVVAGFATTLYAAYHFHRLAPFGVVANLLAMPVVSLVVMPAGLLALLALPFGLDGPLWRLMGLGVDWMIAVSQWVANLPGSVGRISAFGTGPLLLATVGLLLVCLLRTPLRLTGGIVALGAVLWAVQTPQPDILVADHGRAVAVRQPDGRLTVMNTSRDRFAVRDWLAADGDARAPDDTNLRAGFLCDQAGCIARLKDGARVSLVQTAEAFEEDCERATVLVTARLAPPYCGARVFDRTTLRPSGAIALYRTEKGFASVPVRPAGYDRPWARAPAGARATGAGQPTPAAPPEAAPRLEDVGPDD